ncbi:MAG: peptidase U35 phage prohead HK97 [Rhodospirillaceae bacterium]|nr:MAG: peptidase U35 phage prohead HK97 [Rhodospirillaceae bacterium]
MATIRFSDRPDVEPFWRDIVAGVVRHVSVSGPVQHWVESRQGSVRIRHAARWTPLEISFVPIPADPGATTRSFLMPDTAITVPPPVLVPEVPVRPQPVPMPIPYIPEVPIRRSETNAAIRSIARPLDLPQSWIDGQIDADVELDGAKRNALDELMKRSTARVQTMTVLTTLDPSPADLVRQYGEALYARITPAHTPSDPARQYIHDSPAAMAGRLLVARRETIFPLPRSSRAPCRPPATSR